MASSGKKGKKSKGKTVTLTDFLQETPGVSTLPVKKYNWSDEVEDALVDGYESRAKGAVALPTAPRAARGPDVSEDRIPTHPPYIAYISNLPYDIEEDDIRMFFEDMNISSMRLPRDDRGGEGGKLKGFGYVEFEDRATLVDAISILDTNLKGRRIKIDVATSSDTDRRRGGGRMDIGRDRPERPEVAMGDWRSGPRETPQSDSRESRGGGGGGGGFSRDREGPPESNRAGAWRDSAERPERPSFSDRDRDRGGFTRDSDRDRGGGFNRDSDRGFSDRDRDRGSFTRDSDRDRGFNRDSDRGGFRESGFSDRSRFGDRDRDRDDRKGGSFGPRRNFGDREGSGFDREREGGGGGFPRRDEGPRDEGRDQNRSRPKLQLAPRTKPVEDAPIATETSDMPPPAPVATPVPSASIFGSAKPVDTSARERQIEERLAKEKDMRPAGRDGSRDNKNRDSEDDRAPRKEAWGRKRNDDYDDGSQKDGSPERRPNSRGPGPRRTDERSRAAPSAPRDRERGPPRKEEERKPRKEEKPPRENHEKEMPKLKEPEPPNFAASNKFATLEADELSD